MTLQARIDQHFTFYNRRIEDALRQMHFDYDFERNALTYTSKELVVEVKTFKLKLEAFYVPMSMTMKDTLKTYHYTEFENESYIVSTIKHDIDSYKYAVNEELSRTRNRKEKHGNDSNLNSSAV